MSQRLGVLGSGITNGSRKPFRAERVSCHAHGTSVTESTGWSTRFQVARSVEIASPMRCSVLPSGRSVTPV